MFSRIISPELVPSENILHCSIRRLIDRRTGRPCSSRAGVGENSKAHRGTNSSSPREPWTLPEDRPPASIWLAFINEKERSGHT